MKKSTTKKWVLWFLGLFLTGYCGNCLAFPLPTTDIKRIGQSLKQTKLLVDQYKQEVESNLQIIKQIQNGGYAAAAGALFGKIANGDYDRFGSMYKDIGANLQTAATSTQAAFAKKAKREEIHKEMAEKEAKRKAEAAEKAKAAAAKLTADNVESYKESKWKKSYNWIKNHGNQLSSITYGVSNSIDNGGNIIQVGKNIYNSSAGSAIESIYSEEEAKAAEARKKQQEAANLKLQESLDKMNKDIEEKMKQMQAENMNNLAKGGLSSGITGINGTTGTNGTK